MLLSGVNVEVPSGFHNRPDVYFVMNQVGELALQLMLERLGEVESHGLAFTHFQHGLFALGKNLLEAYNTFQSAEANARTIIYMKTIGF